MAHKLSFKIILCTTLLSFAPSQAFLNKELTQYAAYATMAAISAYTVGHNLNAWFGSQPAPVEIETSDSDFHTIVTQALANDMPISPEIISLLKDKNLEIVLKAYNSQLRLIAAQKSINALSADAQSVLNNAKNTIRQWLDQTLIRNAQ